MQETDEMQSLTTTCIIKGKYIRGKIEDSFLMKA